jgi:hypothetical protein
MWWLTEEERAIDDWNQEFKRKIRKWFKEVINP